MAPEHGVAVDDPGEPVEAAASEPMYAVVRVDRGDVM